MFVQGTRRPTEERGQFEAMNQVKHVCFIIDGERGREQLIEKSGNQLIKHSTSGGDSAACVCLNDLSSAEESIRLTETMYRDVFLQLIAPHISPLFTSDASNNL